MGMETKIITVPICRPAKNHRKKTVSVKMLHGAVMVAAGVAVAFVTGIILGLHIAQAAEPQQMAREMEIPPTAVGQLLSVAELVQDKPSYDTPMTGEEMEALLEACEAEHIAPELALGLIQVESSFRSDAVNPVSGCYGYCQLNPRYFPEGLSPADNLRTGIGYLAEQLERYDNLEAALTAYNAGHDTGSRTYANMVLEAASAFLGEGS